MKIFQIEEFGRINGASRSPGASEDQKTIVWDNASSHFIYSEPLAPEVNTIHGNGLVLAGDQGAAGQFWGLDANQNPGWYSIPSGDHLQSVTRPSGTNDLRFTLTDSTNIDITLGELAWQSSSLIDNKILAIVGDRQYTNNHYIVDGQTITASLDNLDSGLNTVNASLTSHVNNTSIHYDPATIGTQLSSLLVSNNYVTYTYDAVNNIVTTVTNLTQFNTGDLAEDGNLYYTEARVSANTDVSANTLVRHSHANKTVLDGITDVGSGSIITVAERNILNQASQSLLTPLEAEILTEGRVADILHIHGKTGIPSTVAYLDQENVFLQNATFRGDVTVQGNFVRQNVTDLDVSDNIIEVNSGETASGVAARYAGIQVDRGTLHNQGLVFDEDNDTWRIGEFDTLDGDVQGTTTTTITLDSNASSIDDTYNGSLIKIFKAGEVAIIRTITDYVGSTRVATFIGDISGVDSTWMYRILVTDNTHRILDEPRADGKYFNSIGTITADNTDITFDITRPDGSRETVSIPGVTITTAGLMSSDDKSKLNGIERNANNYTLPSDVVQDSDYNHTDNNLTDALLTNIQANNAKNSYPAADATKLAGIENGAQVNIGTDLSFISTPTHYTITSNTGTDAIITGASASQAGVMTASDKIKLNSIPAASNIVTTNTGQTITGGKTFNDGSGSPVEIKRDASSSINLKLTNGGGAKYLGINASQILKFGSSIDANANDTVYTEANANSLAIPWNASTLQAKTISVPRATGGGRAVLTFPDGTQANLDVGLKIDGVLEANNYKAPRTGKFQIGYELNNNTEFGAYEFSTDNSRQSGIYGYREDDSQRIGLRIKVGTNGGNQNAALFHHDRSVDFYGDISTEGTLSIVNSGAPSVDYINVKRNNTEELFSIDGSGTAHITSYTSDALITNGNITTEGILITDKIKNRVSSDITFQVGSTNTMHVGASGINVNGDVDITGQFKVNGIPIGTGGDSSTRVNSRVYTTGESLPHLNYPKICKVYLLDDLSGESAEFMFNGSGVNLIRQSGSVFATTGTSGKISLSALNNNGFTIKNSTSSSRTIYKREELFE